MEYLPLNSLLQEIRIVKIVPNSSFGSSIEAAIEHVSLTQLPSYTALSYCWGGEEKPASISIENQLLPVTASLFDALQNLRAKGLKRVWIDAICINQEDNAEKIHQIQLMRAIYQHARSVVAWLGNDDSSENGAALFRNLAKLQLPVHQVRRGSYLDRDLWSLLRNVYWTRIWIVQEIALGRRVIAMCGQSTIDWEKLSTVLRGAVVRAKASAETVPPYIGCIEALISIRDQISTRRNAGAMSLLEVVCMTSASQSTNPKDKIYGLLGLVGDADSLVPIPTYDKRHTVENMCQELTLKIIGLQDQLSVVPLLGRGCEDLSVTSGIPSWTPLWHALDGSKLRRQIACLTQNPRSAFYSMLLSDRLMASGNSKPIVTQENGVLTCESLYIGDIAFQTRTISEPSTELPTSHDETRLPPSNELPNPFDVIFAAFLGLSGAPQPEFAPARRRGAPVVPNLSAEKLNAIVADRFVAHIQARDVNRYELDMFVPEFLRIWRSSYDAGLVPEIQQWVEDHRQLVLLGKTLQNWCKSITWQLTSMRQRARMAMRRQYGEQQTVKRSVLPQLFYFVENRMRLISTTKGNIGWAHERSRVGDSIFILKGSTVPVILRPRPEGGFVLVGDAYVQGMMAGEAMGSEYRQLWSEVQIH